MTDPARPAPPSSPGRLVVATATAADRAAWDAFVDARLALPGDDSMRHATGYHHWAWRDVFARSFGHESTYLIARRERADASEPARTERGNGAPAREREGGPRGEAPGSGLEQPVFRPADPIEGILPLTLIRSRLFGRSLTSLPFLNYGGVVADSDDAARALLDAAADVARKVGCRHVELRHIARRFPDLACKEHKVTMHLPLETGMWDRIDRKARNQVRKAEKSGLTVSRGGAERLDEFYVVFARNMRDLGTPVYAKAFFAEVLAAFPDRARLVVVKLKDQPVAAGLTFQTGTTVEVPWASSIRDFNSLCPNHLLYWHVIETAAAEGGTRLDFGRSTPGEGTFKFKEQWGAAPVPLHWEYVLLDGAAMPDTSPKNPKYRLMIAAWQKLPLPVANAFGPRIVRSIP